MTRVSEKKTHDGETVWYTDAGVYGTIGMTQEWLMHDNITPAETVVEMMFHSMPESLKELFFGK